MKITEIKAGDYFVCTKEVFMRHTNRQTYTKGQVYKSEFDDCITNDLGDKSHFWSTEGVEKINNTNYYFDKLEASVVSEMNDEIVITGKDAEILSKHLSKQFFKSAEQIIHSKISKQLTPIDTPTPGPWYAVNYGGFINLQTEDMYESDNLLDEEKCASAIANGRLAAAAPDLLKALIDLINFTSKPVKGNKALEAALTVAHDVIRSINGGEHACLTFSRRPYTENVLECVICGKVKGS